MAYQDQIMRDLNRRISENPFVQATRAQARDQSTMLLRYPLNVEQADAPFILFTRHKANYNSSATTTGKVELVTKDHVSLYMPMGISFNDSANYDMAATGIVGNAVQAIAAGDPSKITMGDVTAVLEKASEGIGTIVGGALGAGASSLGGGRIGAILATVAGGVSGGGLAKSLAQEYQRHTQTTLNPREFMLYKSPGLRSFSFRFRFIPDSDQEAQQAEQIVYWFRKAMYPEKAGNYSYRFPDAIQIEFQNMTGVPRIPEVFLTNASITYNPNSMSYFKQDNRPVEINLSLDFKEMQPITRESIQNEGF